MSEKLPVHGFVLAGGKSSRMGTDKALLEFCGRPLVEVAVEKLRTFCAEVSIVGNREDLARFAPVVWEERVDCGPAAGMEAGLEVCSQPWAMFIPADVPLVPVSMLRRWAMEITRCTPIVAGCVLSVDAQDQPVFALLRPSLLPLLGGVLDEGERKLSKVLDCVEDRLSKGFIDSKRAERYSDRAQPSKTDMEFWFSNLNTPDEFDIAEMWARERRD